MKNYIFKNSDNGPNSPVQKYDGHTVQIVREITEPENGYDAEVLPMFELRDLTTGEIFASFPDEIKELKAPN